MLNVLKISCNYENKLLGSDDRTVMFGWIIGADGKNITQEAYSIEINGVKSDWVESDQSVHVPYNGTELTPSTRYNYRVKVRDNRGEESPWSEPDWFETGLLSWEKWMAPFISPRSEREGEKSPGWLLKKDFILEKKVSSARIYATSLGVYELNLNGKMVGKNTLAPGWTDYKKRLLYQTYDVTDLLAKGENKISAGLGCGWYKGDIASWEGQRNTYGSRNALSLQMLLTFEDNTEKWINSDESWSSSLSPVLYSEIYHGEIYDARLENSSADEPVDIIEQDTSIIQAQDGPLVTEQEVLPVIEKIKTPTGKTILDFGQNLTGRVRFSVRGKAGDKVVLKHGEILDSEGELYIENLRSARQEIEYILKGDGEESYEPHFTFQGFRYVLVEEHPGEIDSGKFHAVVLHSEMKDLGSFKCSNELVNQLHHNIKWGMKGNFLDVPTDCPQRDERLGWTGDAQAFISTASYLKQTAPFFRKWLRDLKSDQLENGGVPHVIPNVLDYMAGKGLLESSHSATGWGDAAIICPWELYRAYGDKKILEEQYSSMAGWIAYMEREAEGGLIWNSGFHFGDWLALDAAEGSYFGATPNDLTATAFYANSVEIMAKTAALLDRPDDKAKYDDLHKRIKEKFIDTFYSDKGELKAQTQTAHVLTLMFSLLEESNRKNIVDSLARLIEERDNHLSTGFLGTPYLCRVLSNNGRNDVAYKLLLQTDYPSWLYPVTKGATTIWEHWDGLKPDGSLWSADMNSFNHYAYGAVGHWLYETVGGIQSDSKTGGYKNIVFKPQPGEGITHAETSYESPYGEIYLKWEKSGENLHMKVTVPPNTQAVLHFPEIGGKKEKAVKLGSGNYEWNL
ncbi:MAG: hypothetical protein B6241_13040 [Spirochaetaceae bacterium 4572_59]|nr:MAG: hypothetical protein B6241_13040 [Spirochaetaceae bacterium 4572_59]